MGKQFYIANHSATPMRAETAHRSEMVNMLMLGDLYEVIESIDHWHKIRTEHDGYEGWIFKRGLVQVDAEFYLRYSHERPVFAATAIDNCKGEKGFARIEFGNRLPLYKDRHFYLGTEKFEYDGETIIPTEKPSLENILRTGLQMTGTPYLWGGRSIFGIDCSGFTQLVYKLNGIALRRDARQQVEDGYQVLGGLSNAEPGDLAFFAEKENVSHVGILTGEGRIIHASDTVRVDRIDDNGIFNTDLQNYTLKVKQVRRYILD
jgi:cell wall-associated NlpC family hydrolase